MKESEFGGGDYLRPEHEDFASLPEVVDLGSVDKNAIKDRIIDKVIDAAEHDEPLEQSYEMSHEKKSFDAAATDYAPMQSIGTILQHTNQSKVPNNKIPQELYIPTSSPPNSVDEQKLQVRMSYKQALRFGLMAGVLAGLISLIVLLT